MACIEKYLQDRLADHCLRWGMEHLLDELESDSPEFIEEVESHKRLMEMGIWRNGEIIDTAYYMKIPKKALYRFGYTKKEINRIFSEIFAEDEYPY